LLLLCVRLLCDCFCGGVLLGLLRIFVKLTPFPHSRYVVDVSAWTPPTEALLVGHFKLELPDMIAVSLIYPGVSVPPLTSLCVCLCGRVRHLLWACSQHHGRAWGGSRKQNDPPDGCGGRWGRGEGKDRLWVHTPYLPSPYHHIANPVQGRSGGSLYATNAGA